MGAILSMLGLLTYVVVGLLGLIMCVGILLNAGGPILAIVGFFLFPIAMAVAPWIPVVTAGNWTAVLVIYGGGLLGVVLNGVGGALESGSFE
jgi:hypothetical protein